MSNKTLFSGPNFFASGRDPIHFITGFVLKENDLLYTPAIGITSLVFRCFCVTWFHDNLFKLFYTKK